MDDDLLKLTEHKRHLQKMLTQCDEAILKMLALRIRGHYGDNHKSKLKIEEIIAIRKMKDEGISIKQIAFEFRISKSWATAICSKKYLENKFLILKNL
jgi:DNA invertase Pin-like site-specific DNA recombinase